MENTRLKGPRFEKRLGMKGSKEKNKGLGTCKKDQEHHACIKSMQRRSRTLGA